MDTLHRRPNTTEGSHWAALGKQLEALCADRNQFAAITINTSGGTAHVVVEISDRAAAEHNSPVMRISLEIALSEALDRAKRPA